MHLSVKPIPQLVFTAFLGFVLFGVLFLSGLKNEDLEGLRAEPVHQWACNLEGRKYQEVFEGEGGFFYETNICPFFDLEEGLEYAKKCNRPALLYFTGHTSYSIFPPHKKQFYDPLLNKILRNNVVIIALYVDDITPLPYPEKINGIEVSGIGRKNFQLEKMLYNTIAQPYFAVVDYQLNNFVQPFASQTPKFYRTQISTGIRAFHRQHGPPK